MSWFADLAGRAESLLNNLDEQTGAALRNHNGSKAKKIERNEYNMSRPNMAVGSKKKSPRPQKKNPPILESKFNYVPSRKPSPISYNQSQSVYIPTRKLSPTSHQARSQFKEVENKETNCTARCRKFTVSPARKLSARYTLHNTPMTMVGDVLDYPDSDDQFGLRQRRFSLPPNLETLEDENWTYKYQNLEIENAMLKNELNVMNKEVSDLLDRLRKNEDGNDVDSAQELKETHIKMETTYMQNQRVILDKDSLTSQLEVLKDKVNELTSGVLAKTREQKVALENEIVHLNNRNKELDDRIQELTDKSNEKESAQMKLETELRHAQSAINDLQTNLEKSTQECRRLEKEWEAYKLRVKSMLNSKDNEIKTLQAGEHIDKDKKDLTEQIERLKDERDDLSDAIMNVRNECSDMKQYMDHLESRHSSAERVILALRDALRDERMARNRADAQSVSLSKELKTIQIETGQTIASLRTALRDKEEELKHVRETSASGRGSDASALNVADYDVNDSIENDKIQYLTHTLVQRQTKIDNLLAHNNMLKIQMDKLQSKYKAEVSAVRTNNTHSVVNFQDGDMRARSRANHNSTFSKFSLRLGVTLKRYPIIRICVMFYMICLHFWVLTVLFTNTPQDYVTRPAKA